MVGPPRAGADPRGRPEARPPAPPRPGHARRGSGPWDPMAGSGAPETPTMKLSDTQSLILGKASQHLERLATAPQGLPAAARNAVFRSMLKNGLLAECALPRGYGGLAWREEGDGARVAL